MRRPSIDRRKLASIAMILFPPLATVMVALVVRAGTGIHGLVLAFLPMGLCGSLLAWDHLRKPLISTGERWGVSGRRQPQRFRLWMFLAYLAALCPILAAFARQRHELRESLRKSRMASDASMEAFYDEAIARWIRFEQGELALAREFELKAAECREKEALGHQPDGETSWARRVSEYEGAIARSRSRAAFNRGFIEQLKEKRERSGYP